MTVLVGAQTGEVILASQVPQGKAFGLGDRYVDHTGREYVYLQAGAAITANFVVRFGVDHIATQATTANSLYGDLIAIAVSTGDNMATGDQSWFQVKGPCSAIQVLASCAANVRINTTATAGALDDDGGVGSKVILGLALTSARAASAGPAPAILNYPQVGATL